MDLPDNSPLFKSLEETPLGSDILKLIELNRRLIAFSSPERKARWKEPDVIATLYIYDKTLKDLGFNEQELRELFPVTRQWPTMLSLVDQSVLACGMLSRQKTLKFPKDFLLPKELREKVDSDKVIFHSLQRTLINLNATKRKDFIAKHNFNNKMTAKLYEPLNTTLKFKAFTAESSIEIIEFLLKLITDSKLPLLETCVRDCNVFHLAAEYAPTFALKELTALEEFNPHTRNSHNANLLHFAVKCLEDSNLDFLLSLPKIASLIDEGNSEKLTPLHSAVITKSLPKVRILVTAGADLNLTDNHAHTALHYAAGETWGAESSSKIVSFLLSQKNIQTELQNSDHLTAYELSFIAPVNWYIVVAFQNYYTENPESHYEAELNSLNCFDLVLTAIRESRGLILFGKYIKKFPDVILDFRDAQGKNIVQIINQGRENNPQRRYLVQQLLKIVTITLPHLFLTRNEAGQTGLEQTLASYNWSWRNGNDFSHAYDWSTLVHSEFFYYNTTPNERFYNFLNKMPFLALALYIGSAVALQVGKEFNLKWNLIAAALFAVGVALFLFWANTSSRNRDELGAKLKEIALVLLKAPCEINFYRSNSRKANDEELGLLPEKKVEEIERIEPGKLGEAQDYIPVKRYGTT